MDVSSDGSNTITVAKLKFKLMAEPPRITNCAVLNVNTKTSPVLDIIYYKNILINIPFSTSFRKSLTKSLLPDFMSLSVRKYKDMNFIYRFIPVMII